MPSCSDRRPAPSALAGPGRGRPPQRRPLPRARHRAGARPVAPRTPSSTACARPSSASCPRRTRTPGRPTSPACAPPTSPRTRSRSTWSRHRGGAVARAAADRVEADVMCDIRPAFSGRSHGTNLVARDDARAGTTTALATAARPSSRSSAPRPAAPPPPGSRRRPHPAAGGRAGAGRRERKLHERTRRRPHPPRSCPRLDRGAYRTRAGLAPAGRLPGRAGRRQEWGRPCGRALRPARPRAGRRCPRTSTRSARP